MRSKIPLVEWVQALLLLVIALKFDCNVNLILSYINHKIHERLFCYTFLCTVKSKILIWEQNLHHHEIVMNLYSLQDNMLCKKLSGSNIELFLNSINTLNSKILLC